VQKIRQIPDIIEKARRTKLDIDAKIVMAQTRADEIVAQAIAEARASSQQISDEARKQLQESQRLMSEAKDADRLARWQSANVIEAARAEAKQIASEARKEAKAKKQGAEEALNRVTQYALEIRREAEANARAIAGKAHDAMEKYENNLAAIQAMENRLKNYEEAYPIPRGHLLDELASDFAFDKVGEKLKLARERTRVMDRNGTSATCNYPEGWKRDHALKFVLNTFNGKVDTILARVKPTLQGRLAQEIKDAYSLVNKDGEVYKDAKINKEYLDSRLDELKWAVAVLKVKERMRDEQRTIREQIREEEKAKREIEKARRQAEREEEIVNRAIERVRKQFEQASDAEKAVYQAQLTELNSKLLEAEEKSRRALSMAQQTKRGNVYIISNIGSFGENVYKIGLTRRLDPTERVRELGDASVPFPFDVHAMIFSEDAPSLESTLQKRFVEQQVNKVNRRKEFFKVGLREIKTVVEDMGLEADWTIEAEASQYRESLALEQAIHSNAEVRRRWIEQQEAQERTEVESDEDEELEQVEA
jgi:hypothetical protein